MASNPQIISDLKVIQEAGHGIDVLTSYKGVPFICHALIINIKNDLVQIVTKDRPIVCLKNEKRPQILGSDFFEPSLASVVSLDIPSGKIELNQFSYVGTKLGERMIVRVEPKEPLSVNLEIEGQKISAQLADISINGLGVLVDSKLYTPLLKPGADINTSLQLHTGSIESTGIVLSALKVGDNFRLSIRYNQKNYQKMRIYRYLVDRRAEIGAELNENYRLALQDQ